MTIPAAPLDQPALAGKVGASLFVGSPLQFVVVYCRR
jgi:hypothetical protein